MKIKNPELFEKDLWKLSNSELGQLSKKVAEMIRYYQYELNNPIHENWDDFSVWNYSDFRENFGYLRSYINYFDEICDEFTVRARELE